MTESLMAEMIPMTKENKKIWDKALEESQGRPTDFIYFVDILDCQTRYGSTSVVLKIFPEYIEDSRQLIMAWLYPSLIEVEE